MAVTNGLRSFVDSYVLELISDELQSSFITSNPMLYFLAGQGAEGMGKFGSPNTSLILGNGGLGRASREELSGSKEHQFRFQASEPNDGTTVTYGGATPTASGFAEDRVKTAGCRWTHYMEPLKIREHSFGFTQNSKVKIGSLLEEAVGMTLNAMLKRINTGLRSGTLNASAQEAEVWSQFLGTRHVLTANNTAYRVDRSVETVLNPKVYTAEQVLGTGNTAIDLKISRVLRVGNGTVTGMSSTSKNGKGPTLFITTPALWQDLADQAEGTVQIYQNGIPNWGLSGFKKPIIQHDEAYYIADDDVASGEMECYNLETWLFEVYSGKNFTVPSFSEWTQKWKSQEGGEYYRFTNMELMARLTCRRPWDNAIITGLTTND